ncbi:MAG: hypothetical protein AB7O59_03150 [Pirellulales bacterium]
MHARELVDVAGLVAHNGSLLIGGVHQPAAGQLEQYWSTSKFRFESWMRALKTYAALAESPPQENFDRWIDVRAALDEIFASEILTRVWSAVLVACDRNADSNLAEPIARSVLSSHYEARHRAMALLVYGDGLGVKQAASVNRLRRRAERWTDMLIGGLLHLHDVREFAVEPERAEDFASDLARRRGGPAVDQAWRLALVSMRNAFHSGMSVVAANPDANARITASILGCFPGELFDSTGVFRSLWMVRLAANASDAQGMIGELLEPGVPAPSLRRSLPPGRRLR